MKEMMMGRKPETERGKATSLLLRKPVASLLATDHMTPHPDPPLPDPSLGTMESFSSKSLVLQAEKKLLSKMAGRSVAHLFADETSSEVLDELYRVSKEYTRSRPQAQRVIKDLIKVAVKVAVLHRSGCFNPSELALATRFRQKLRQGAMTALSFGEVDFTFEAAVLASLLTECRDVLLELVERHLTPKSHGRIRHVFDHFSDAGLLTALYGPDYTQHLGKICGGLRKLLDEGKL